VRWPVDESFAGKFEDGFFKSANEVHLSEHCRKELGICCFPVGWCRAELNPWGSWI
jgi:hypothetical protein